MKRTFSMGVGLISLGKVEKETWFFAGKFSIECVYTYNPAK